MVLEVILEMLRIFDSQLVEGGSNPEKIFLIKQLDALPKFTTSLLSTHLTDYFESVRSNC